MYLAVIKILESERFGSGTRALVCAPERKYQTRWSILHNFVAQNLAGKPNDDDGDVFHLLQRPKASPKTIEVTTERQYRSPVAASNVDNAATATTEETSPSKAP